MSLSYKSIFNAVLLSLSAFVTLYTAAMDSGGAKILRIALVSSESSGTIFIRMYKGALKLSVELPYNLLQNSLLLIDTPVRVPAGYSIGAYTQADGMSMSVSGLLRIVILLGTQSGLLIYKCTAVYPLLCTWDGYKVIKDGDYYKYSGQLKLAMAYSLVKPVLGCIYTADAKIQVKNILIKPVKKKAYLVTYSDGYHLTLLGLCDANKTTGTLDDAKCNYYIFNGSLYYYANNTYSSLSSIQVGTSSLWTAISGAINPIHTPLSAAGLSYGICDGCLYKLSESTATKISDLDTFIKVWGYSGTSSPYPTAYALTNLGTLYAVQNLSVTAIKTGLPTTLYISGASKATSNSSYNIYSYFVYNNDLYKLLGTSVSKIVEGGVTACSGVSCTTSWDLSTRARALFIQNGQLYMINNSTAVKISDLTGWTFVKGSLQGLTITYAFGAIGNTLYRIKNTYSNWTSGITVLLITTVSNLYDIPTGYSSRPNTNPVAVVDSMLYAMPGFYIIDSGWNWEKVYGGINTNSLYQSQAKAYNAALAIRAVE